MLADALRIAVIVLFVASAMFLVYSAKAAKDIFVESQRKCLYSDKPSADADGGGIAEVCPQCFERIR